MDAILQAHERGPENHLFDRCRLRATSAWLATDVVAWTEEPHHNTDALLTDPTSPLAQACDLAAIVYARDPEKFGGIEAAEPTLFSRAFYLDLVLLDMLGHDDVLDLNPGTPTATRIVCKVIETCTDWDELFAHRNTVFFDHALVGLLFQYPHTRRIWQLIGDLVGEFPMVFGNASEFLLFYAYSTETTVPPQLKQETVRNIAHMLHTEARGPLYTALVETHAHNC
jgi:hypothetical protein